MKQNLVSFAFTEADFTDLKQKISEIQAKIEGFAIELHLDNKRELKTLGDRSLPFTEQAFFFANQQKTLVPAFVSMEEFSKDLNLFKQSKELIKMLEVTLERLNDTYIAAGSDAFSTARKIYDSVKSAIKGNIPGAAVAFDELKKRYIRMKGKTEEQNNNTPVKTKNAEEAEVKEIE
jgi:hypothetical protein